MYDVENKDYPSTSSLSKLGMTAIGYLAAGVFLFLLMIFAKFKGLGIVLGGVVCIVGIVSLMSKDNADRKAGAVISSAGVLTLLSKIPVIAPVAGTLMSIGAVSLLVLGVMNGLKFLAGLKKRS